MFGMRQREIITFLGGAAASWPLTVGAQQSVLPVIGHLSARSRDIDIPFTAAFHRGLNEVGYVDGQNVEIDFRWALGQYDQLAALATDLVRRKVAVIATSGGTPAALAAKAATTSIPIVFGGLGDPVAVGLVASLNRPGANITGVSTFGSPLTGKRLELLHELAPSAATIALLVNSSNPSAKLIATGVVEAGRALGLQLHVVNAAADGEIDAAFATLAQLRVGALFVGPDPFFVNQRAQIVALAARHALPAIYSQREFAEAGGLMSYGASYTDAYRLVGIYAGRILKGTKPADLPVMQPTKYELVINLKTAKALGLDVPAKLLALADEVIE
jgi:putative ABC transport system substrate-binding protein